MLQKKHSMNRLMNHCRYFLYFIYLKLFSFISQTNYSPLYYEKGLSQIYEQPSNQYLDISIYKEEELLYNAEQNYYPVVIVLQVGKLNNF